MINWHQHNFVNLQISCFMENPCVQGLYSSELGNKSPGAEHSSLCFLLTPCVVEGERSHGEQRFCAELCGGVEQQNCALAQTFIIQANLLERFSVRIYFPV